jgi:4-methyl-5(b-hydroxyethyl)-thiazole monophosphate biosynthesis
MKALVPLAEGFEEIEFSTIADVLRRADIEVTVAGLKAGATAGAHGIKVTPDVTIDEADADDFDIIALPGGNPGYINLGQSDQVLRLLKDMHQKGKYVTAICAAPSVLAKAGVIQGKRATVYPGMEDSLTGAEPSAERVVVDGRIITSRGPGTALEFAIKLVEVLMGRGKAEEVAQRLLAKL